MPDFREKSLGSDRTPWWEILYERQHQIWPAWAASDGEAAAEADFVLALVGRDGPGTLLDVGCGSGRLSCAFAERGWRVLGIDISPALVERARRRAIAKRVTHSAHFTVWDLRAHSLESKYDLILFWDSVLSIWSEAEIQRILSRWKGSLEARGTVVVQQLNPAFFLKKAPIEIAFEDASPGPGRTERRYEFDPATGILSDHVTYLPKGGKREALPTQRLHLLRAEQWLALLRRLGFNNGRAAGSDEGAVSSNGCALSARSFFFAVAGDVR